MGTVDFKDQKRFERRIGRRVEVDPVDVTWVIPQAGRWGRKRPPLEHPGRIENVSITGAAIVGPADLDLRAGAKAVVRSRGRDSIVVIRHRSPIAGSASVRFGVELPRSASVLRRQIQELLDPMLAPPPAERDDLGPRLGIRPGLGAHTTRLGLPRLDGSDTDGLLAAKVDAEQAVTEAPPAGSASDAVVDLTDVVVSATDTTADADVAGVAPDPTEPTPDTDGVVLDLTDTTLATRGEPVVELSGPATELVEALRALEPILVDRSAPAPPAEPAVAELAEPAVAELAAPVAPPQPEAVAPPEPEAVQPRPEAIHLEPDVAVPTEVEPRPVEPGTVEPVASAVVEQPATDAAAEPEGPAAPVEPPDSVGRQVLDDVFRLMGD